MGPALGINEANDRSWFFKRSVLSLQYELKPQIDASTAFKLHDTYGFPINLTRIMAEERGMSVDLKGYEELMEKARDLARSGGKEGTETRLTDLPPDAIAKLQGEKIPSTNDQPKYKGEPIQATAPTGLDLPANFSARRIIAGTNVGRINRWS